MRRSSLPSLRSLAPGSHFLPIPTPSLLLSWWQSLAYSLLRWENVVFVLLCLTYWCSAKCLPVSSVSLSSSTVLTFPVPGWYSHKYVFSFLTQGLRTPGLVLCLGIVNCAEANVGIEMFLWWADSVPFGWLATNGLGILSGFTDKVSGTKNLKEGKNSFWLMAPEISAHSHLASWLLLWAWHWGPNLEQMSFGGLFRIQSHFSLCWGPSCFHSIMGSWEGLLAQLSLPLLIKPLRSSRDSPPWPYLILVTSQRPHPQHY